MRILFVTSNRVGDAVLSTGLLDHLLRAHPTARFTVACGPPAFGVFARMPRLERLIAFGKQRYDRHWLALWLRVAFTWWDLAIDLRGSALTLLIPARRRRIMRGGRRAQIQVDRLGAVLGLHPGPLPVAWTAPEDRTRAAEVLPDGTPWIGLGPSANWEGKIWPAANFAELARRLGELLPRARIAVFAGPGETERALAAPLLAALPGAVDLVGSLDLPQVAACLARCAIFAGNDSGLMHLAAATGTPTLGLFGTTDPVNYAPAGRRTVAAVAPGAPDAQMADLTVEAAFAAARTLLAEPA